MFTFEKIRLTAHGAISSVNKVRTNFFRISSKSYEPMVLSDALKSKWAELVKGVEFQIKTNNY